MNTFDDNNYAAVRLRHAHARVQQGVRRRDSGAEVPDVHVHRLRRHRLHGQGRPEVLLVGRQRRVDQARRRAQLQVRRRLPHARREARRPSAQSAGSYTFNGQFTGSTRNAPAHEPAMRSRTCCSAISVGAAPSRSTRRWTITSATRARTCRTTGASASGSRQLRRAPRTRNRARGAQQQPRRRIRSERRRARSA